MDQPLRVFVTVVEKENFSRAAEELHMTQPAVSQYIRSLERTIGTRLLERSNKFVRLNKAGEIVYHHAKEILGLYTNMQDLVDDLLHTASGSLSIGASYTFGEYVLPHIVAHLHDQYPLIKPSITIGNTSKIATLTASRQLDIGIVEGAFKHEKLHIEPFAEDAMFIIAAANHRLVKKEKVTMEDLKRETWIVREVGSGTREATDKMFDDLKLEPIDLIEFSSTQMIKEAVEAGIGISLLSHWALRKELTLDKLRLVKTDGMPFKRQFSIVKQATPFETKALQVFLQMVREGNVIPKLTDPKDQLKKNARSTSI